MDVTVYLGAHEATTPYISKPWWNWPHGSPKTGTAWYMAVPTKD